MCLDGLKFVITGVLESIDRAQVKIDHLWWETRIQICTLLHSHVKLFAANLTEPLLQAEELIKRHGGKIASSITKSLDYAVVGEEAGVLCCDAFWFLKLLFDWFSHSMNHSMLSIIVAIVIFVSFLRSFSSDLRYHPLWNSCVLVAMLMLHCIAGPKKLELIEQFKTKTLGLIAWNDDDEYAWTSMNRSNTHNSICCY